MKQKEIKENQNQNPEGELWESKQKVNENEPR